MAKRRPGETGHGAEKWNVEALPHIDRVWVRVEIAHDGLRVGQVHEVALDERTQALINLSGYLEIVAPPDGL
jgi:hypothetical protein